MEGDFPMLLIFALLLLCCSGCFIGQPSDSVGNPKPEVLENTNIWPLEDGNFPAILKKIRCGFLVRDLCFSKDDQELFLIEKQEIAPPTLPTDRDPEFPEERVEVLDVPGLTLKRAFRASQMVLLPDQNILSVKLQKIWQENHLCYIYEDIVKLQHPQQVLFTSPPIAIIQGDVWWRFGYRPKAYISPNGKILATVEFSRKTEDSQQVDSTLKVYHINDQKFLWEKSFADEIEKISFSPSSQYFVAFTHHLHVFATEKGTLLYQLPFGFRHIKRICFSQDAKIIFSGVSYDDEYIRKIFLQLDDTNFDIATQYSHMIFLDTAEAVMHMEVHPSQPLLFCGIYRGHRFSPNEDFRVINYQNNNIVHYFSHYPLCPEVIRVSHSGKYIAYIISHTPNGVDSQHYLYLLDGGKTCTLTGKSSVSVPNLVQYLAERNKNMRDIMKWVSGNLDKSQEKHVAEALVGLLTSSSENKQVSAIWAFERLGGRAEVTVPLLLQYLEKQDDKRFLPEEKDQIREAVLWMLCRIGETAKLAVPRLIKLLKDDSNERLRIITTLVLGRIKEKNLTPRALTSLLAEENSNIKAAAKWALKKIQE